MPTRAATVVALVVAACALAACSNGGSSNAASASPSEATSAATSTTTTTAPTTTTSPIVPAGSAADAASALVSAWRNGDQTAALAIATPDAVQAVFAAGDPGRVENRGCNSPPQGPVLCVYRTAAGELQVRVQPRADGWYVDQAIVSAA